MSTKTKLLLVPCSGEETSSLAESIYRILRQDYGLEDQVEFLASQHRKEIEKDMPKSHQHPLVGDYFSDGEVQVDIGSNQLKDVVRGKHIALVEHLLTPNRKLAGGDEQIVSVNDHHMTVRGYLDVFHNVDLLQTTLVAPYLTYVRSHSIEKYRKKGFSQYDSLRKVLVDFQRDGLSALITVDPHSTKAAQIAEELGIDFHAVNPFQSTRAINPYKLGLADDKAKEILKRLRPFYERFVGLKGQHAQHLYLISVDDGTERRVENFTERVFSKLSPEEVYSLIAYMEKDRLTYELASTRFKKFSQINERKIDPEGIYIILDDMFASGGTGMRVARIFKQLGVKRVEVWTSHAVTMPVQYAAANERECADKVVCLDTVPQNPALNVEYIKASADLLAAELYKAHQKLVAMR